ncbi:disease resistance protein RUN1-like [Silene latifolia]|uniref:disease resistance protein RUN1-like n=1 Tax=Silene latifolia TaxID=37657 RepID=UPI003D7849C8
MSSTPNDDDQSITRCTTLTTPIPPYLPPPLLSTRLNWDVFLSFRGIETRHTMTQSLYDALKSNGIRVFIDGAGMEKGDVIKSSLDEAIADTALAVAIISPKYGDSPWCLDELCGLFECRKRVIPVFYRVEPSDVRRQEEEFGKNFDSMVEENKQYQKTEEDAAKAKANVEKWRKALKDVGNISGYPCRSECDDPEAIERIVKQVVGELKNIPDYVAKITVGLDSRVNQVLEKLDIHSNGVKFLGIHGTPGIGKTTLAKAAFNKLAVHFKRRCFVSNVREQCSNEEGVLSVQNKLLEDLSLGRVMLAKQETLGKKAIKEIVNENRVLVVLDDVSQANQLESLGIVRDWLEQGSRVIITSRDREVINLLCCDNDKHEAKKLSESESLELFSIYAFGRRKPTDEYLKISEEIVELTDGLPLALEVFGSSLVKKTMSEWENSLKKFEEFGPEKLQGVLKISYDALDAQDKAAFLDISCLLLQMNMERGDVVDILEGCGLRGELAIGNLVTKSLLKISESNKLWMHDQIRDMGRQFVMDENSDDPGKRSRLWDSRDIGNVLRLEKGTGAIRGIVLDIKQPSTTAFNYLFEKIKNLTRQKADENDDAIFHTKSFEKMDSLKLLQINYSQLRGNMKYMPSVLRCLQWRGCSEKTVSENIPEELRVLDVSGSNIQQLWPSYLPRWSTNKVARNLVVLNLSNNPRLTALPDMSSNRHLEKLVLKQCVGLTKIHDSIGKMSSLVHLNLQGCSDLVDFPSDVTGMKGLRELILSGCSKFRGLPHDVRSLKSLIQLLLDGTAIKNLPGYLFHLTQLEVLSLNRCNQIEQLPRWIGSLSSLKDLSLNQTMLKTLPDTIGSLSSLEKLSLVHCSSLETLPDSVESLKSLVELHLTGTSIQELPPSICSLSYLKVLSAGQCSSLSLLPVTIGGLAFVTELQLDNTAITCLPDEICSLTCIRKLDLNNCKSLARLPEKIGKLSNLNILWMIGAAIKELPDSIGGLENLTWLNLNNCSELGQLPETIGSLRSLHILMMEDTAVTFLPESFGMLESLMVLKMKKSVQDILNGFDNVLPTSFYKLSRLEEFDASGCQISGQINDDFVMLSKLEVLDLGFNSFHSLPSTLEGLCFLKNLSLCHCVNLRSLPPLPSTLELLVCADCYSLESICDLLNLDRLQELQLANCYKLTDIPGLECLKSLRRLYMSSCTASAAAVKKRLSKITLRNLKLET